MATQVGWAGLESNPGSALHSNLKKSNPTQSAVWTAQQEPSFHSVKKFYPYHFIKTTTKFYSTQIFFLKKKKLKK
jgi:hypothetical protein